MYFFTILILWCLFISFVFVLFCFDLFFFNNFILLITPFHFLYALTAKGRTNIELREQFILADGVSQSMSAFKPKHNAQQQRSGSTAGPITKVKWLIYPSNNLRIYYCIIYTILLLYIQVRKHGLYLNIYSYKHSFLAVSSLHRAVIIMCAVKYWLFFTYIFCSLLLFFF